MADTVIFSYRQTYSFAHRRHPFVKLVALISSTALLSTGDIPRIVIITLLMLALGIMIKVPFGLYLKKSLFFFIMAMLIAASRFAIDRSIFEAIIAAIQFLDIVLAGLLFADSTAPDDLARSLGNIFGFRFAATVEITLRTIGVFFETSQRVKLARRSRMERPLSHPFTYIVSLTSSLVSALLHQGQLLSDALVSRQFNPENHRAALAFTRSDAFALAIIAVISIVLAVVFT